LIVVWRRGGETIPFNRPTTDFTLGVRGGGKSAFLEHRGEGFLKRGHTVFDMFGSRDGEGLAWLRSPWANLDERHPDLEKKILLIHGDNMDIDSPVDTVNVSKVRLKHYEDYDLLISSSPMYSSIDDEFVQVNTLTNILYQRRAWNKIIYVLCREASNLYYSRLRVSKSQVNAKAEMIYLIREARHMGMAMGLDTLKYTSIDLDIRAVTDYIVFKAQGILGFPSDLTWLYGYFQPSFVRNMKPEEFVILSRKGSLGVGLFPEVKWHKKEKENIVKKVGLKITSGDELYYSEDLLTHKTVGDFEHVRMVELYHVGLDGKGMGTLKVSNHPDVQRSSSTVRDHLMRHDEAVGRTGFCAVCRRAGGRFHNRVVMRGRGVKGRIR
jgi:hypothetical protein